MTTKKAVEASLKTPADEPENPITGQPHPQPEVEKTAIAVRAEDGIERPLQGGRFIRIDGKLQRKEA